MPYNSDELSYESEAASHLLAVFEQYAEVNGRDQKELGIKQGAELAGDLYKVTTRASAPAIKAKLDSLGPNFKRAPARYAQKVAQTLHAGGGGEQFGFDTVGKRGKSDRQISSARVVRVNALLHKQSGIKATMKGLGIKSLRGTERKNAQAKRKQLIGERKKVVQQLGKEEARLTLAEQRYAAYNSRVGRIGATAASWLGAMQRLGTKGVRLTGRMRAKGQTLQYSSAYISGDTQDFRVVLVNNAPGIWDLDARDGFVEDALRLRAADMTFYIARKETELTARWEAKGQRQFILDRSAAALLS